MSYLGFGKWYCFCVAIVGLYMVDWNKAYTAGAYIKTKEPTIVVSVPGLVEADKTVTLGCSTSFDNANPHIKSLVWKRLSQSSPTSNGTLTPVNDVTLVTYTYNGGVDKITYGSSVDVKLTEEYGLMFNRMSVHDEGSYCCEVVTGEDVEVSNCADVFVSVLPTIAFNGTNCEAVDKFCKTYGHVGQNLTCVARQYRPFVDIQLKWTVFSLIPMVHTKTAYINYTLEGVTYYEAFSSVEFTKTGNHRYSCTASGTKCKGGCVVSDVVIVSIKHHLALWWIIVPLLLILTFLFIWKWRKQSSRSTETTCQQQPPGHVYHPVTTVEMAKADPTREKL